MGSKEAGPITLRLERFITEHGHHLLSDSRQGVNVGSIYAKDSSESESRIIGDTTNFVVPSVRLPSPEPQSFNSINEDLRNIRSFNIFAKAIGKFITSLGFSFGKNAEQLLEVNYGQVTYTEIHPAEMANYLADHSFNTRNWLFKPENEYFIVTRTLQSPNFSVKTKISKDLKATLDANAGQPHIEGNVKAEYASGKHDEVKLTYTGNVPLVFAVHLEILEFVKDNGKIINMKPLKTVTKLLSDENTKVWP